MDSFKIELISNASAQLTPDNTLSPLTNFSQERLNLEGQWKLCLRKYPTRQGSRNSPGKFMFFDEHFESCLTFIIWNSVSTLPLRILPKQ